MALVDDWALRVSTMKWWEWVNTYFAVVTEAFCELITHIFKDWGITMLFLGKLFTAVLMAVVMYFTCMELKMGGGDALVMAIIGSVGGWLFAGWCFK